MQAKLPSDPRPHSERIVGLLFVGALLIYTCGFLAWYSTTPLGLVASTDDREILALAHQIATLNLPHEAFYRAPGYSALLALALRAGLPDMHLMLFARLFNGLCHLASAGMVFGLARALWQRAGAAYLAAALVGFNPLLLHFAGDALDITLAITLLVAGVWASLRARASRGASAWAATAFSAAVVCRPQLLPLVGLPVLLAWHAGRRGAGDLVASLAPVAILLGGLGGANYLLAEDFRVLPWQGAFNAWAANYTGANGRYFAQTLSIDAYAEDANTARIESELLYRQQRPDSPNDYPTMTRYWRAQALAVIAESPGRWLTLMANKLRYLLNNEEQYNNKTYAFQKARSPWLRNNPICWALVWVTAVGGVLLGWRHTGVRVVLMAVGLCLPGILGFYVSDRFRAPLVPLLAVLAGGICQWRQANTRRPALIAAGVALLLTLWPIGYDPAETLVQDHLILASSASALGLHAQAQEHARTAMALAPRRPAVTSLRCVVDFNAWLAGASALDWPAGCQQASTYSLTARLLAAYAHWRAGQRAPALATWHALAAQPSSAQASALAALFVAHALTPSERVLMTELAPGKDGVVILAAQSAAGDRAAGIALRTTVGETAAALAVAAAERLWGPVPVN